MTFLAALRCDEITAPFVRDGPINGESFLAYVEQVLAPALKHGDIVVMDNLGSPKRAAIDKAIRAKGARRFFLPQYSPDLNPVDPSAGSGGLRKAQKTVAKSRGAHPRRRLAAHRYIARMLLSSRMRKLLPKFRLRFSMKRKDSSGARMLPTAPARQNEQA
jgi:DDE superfamily endonuclease